LEIREDNLADYGGKPVVTSDRLYEEGPLPTGIVMGLAYTSMGGTALYIETQAIKRSKDADGKSKGSGSLKVTGQLGDVMKESAQIASTVARARLAEIDPDSSFFDENDIHMHVPEGATGARVQAFLKLRARDQLAAASDHYAQSLGRSYARLSLRDTRSRWGSCSSKGTLMYSWRLVMAPPAVLNYVAAHECAHLVEMNHSAAFWAIVAELMPDYATHRLWLRENGDRLHRVSFDD